MSIHDPELITLDQARSRLGISKPALLAAIERGDLIQVEMESVRGCIRKMVTSASLDNWISRLNGEQPRTAPASADDITAAMSRQVSAIQFHLSELADKVDAATSRMGRQQERDRRTRLRHTVSSRIGDAFDPHGYYVYLLWGEDDETPIYIGQSRNVLSRLGSHMTDSNKRYRVKSVQLIKCNGAATMRRIEAALIREYSPPMNTVGVTRNGATQACARRIERARKTDADPKAIA